MFKPLVLCTLLLSFSSAVNFTEMKEDVLNYIDALDHPNREYANVFSQNLVIAGEASNTHINIYTDAFAIVSQEKNVSMENVGNVQIMYSEVSSKVDLSSVSMVFDQNVTLYSQRYAYDIVNFNSLLHKYIGKNLLYVSHKEDKKQKKAKLLATNPIIVQDLKSGHIFTPLQVFFENIPEDMAVTPTLFWNVYTQAKELKIKLEYLTEGIGWKSDYNLYLKDDETLDFNSWITVNNDSGIDYEDANITIVTGKQNRVVTQSLATKTDVNMTLKPKAITEDKNPTVSSEYAVFQVPHIESLSNKEAKQIAFLRAKDVHYVSGVVHEKVYDFTEQNLSTLAFSKVLSFENSAENALGNALPNGVVRLYKYDTLGNKRFVASVKMPSIQVNENVSLDIGRSLDVIAEEKMTPLKKSGETEQFRYEIKLENISKNPLVLKLKRSTVETVGKIVMKDSCTKQCTKKVLKSGEVLYEIRLNPAQIYALDIDYTLHYKETVKKGSL